MNQFKNQSGFTPAIIILIIVIVIIAGGAGYYFYKTSSAEKYSSPEKTYSLYVKATEKGDIEAYLECFTEESQDMFRSGVFGRLTPESLKAEFKFHKFHKIAEFKVTEKSSDTAVMASETVEANVLVFKKEKGNWKIDLTEEKKKSNDAKRVAHLMQLRAPLELYYDQHGGYPALSDTSEDGEFLEVLRNFVENLLDPLHPKYFYEYEGTENSYTLKCYCEVEGGNCDMEDGIKDHVFIYSYSLEQEVEKTKEKKEEAKKLIDKALLKIEEIKLEKAKPEADTHKLQTLIGEAIENGKKATELDPKNPEILFQMGNIYFEIKEIASDAKEWAIHYYKKALELEPDNPLYQEKLREIQSQK